MAVELLGRRDQVTDNNGNALSGGSIDVFAAGTTTRVTTYSDSALVQENPNPVPLSGSGRASIWVGSQEVDLRILNAAGTLISEDLGLNPSNVDGGFDGGLVANGSFELDTNSDDVPDGWLSENNAAGSNNGLETGPGNTGAGAQSWRTQSSGSGGGELVSANPFVVNDFDSLLVRFLLRSTVAAVRNIVRIEWYDVTDVLISSTDVYDSTSNPSTFTEEVHLASPPSGARLARIRILGGTSGGTLSGITYWDNVRVLYPEPVTGTFDNLLLAGNTISSTNTNGDITLDPNGTGEVNIEGPLDVNATADFSTTVTVTGLLTASAALTVGTTLGVTGAATLSSTLGVTGLATLSGGLTLTAASSLLAQGTAVFQGVTSFSAQATFSAPTAMAALSLTGALTSTTTLSTDDATAVDLLDANAPLRLGAIDSAHLEAGGNTIQAKGSETTAATLSLNPLGGPIVVGLEGGTDAVELRAQRTLVNASQDAALLVRNAQDGASSIGTAQDVSVQLERSDGEALCQLGYINTAETVLRNLNHGGGVSLQAEDNSGILRTLLSGDPDGQSDMYQAGTSHLATQPLTGTNTTGATVRHRDNSLYDAAVGVFPTTTITTPTMLIIDHAQQLLLLTGATSTITFDEDASIPVGGTGFILNETGSNQNMAIGAGVLFVIGGLNAPPQGTTGIVNHAFIRWVKLNATLYLLTGEGIVGA